ncbi:MAG TPA: site-specific integrase [Methylophilaceae bacterium]|nr:site-specific integrase [Methylophilaceae bacterium]
MTHLTKRNSVYYFRRKIPLELRHLYAGKAEIIFSLQTKNRADAEPLARKLGVQYDEEFAQARAEALQGTNEVPAQPTPAPTSSVKRRLADGLTMESFDVLVARYIQRMREQREVAAGDSRTYEQFLARLRAIVSENKEFLKLGEHPLWDDPRPLWQVEAQRAAAKAVLKGKSSVPASPSIISTSTQPPAASTQLTSLEALVTRWAKERTPEPRTITQYGRAVRLLRDYTRIEYTERLSKADVVKFKDKLLEHGTTSITTNFHLSNLTTLLEYAIGNAIIETNPAKGIRVQVREEDKNERAPFTTDQLNTLFSSPVYSEHERPAGGKGEAAYWLPLLGLFSGARLNELCQLNKTDIRKERYQDALQRESECWVMEITNEGEGQKLKNTASKRRFPIHPSLVELGFINFVQASPGPRVFHELMPSKAYDSISASWSKWFARYLHKIGLKTDALVFHSFRHSFKYYARLNSIPDKLQYAIQGHSSGNVGDEYGGTVYPLAPLVEAMKSYRIPNLKLPAIANH